MDSGSGFTLISTEPDPIITFPDSPGLLYQIKLIALGDWIEELSFVEEIMITESVPAPVIVSETITRLLGANINYTPTLSSPGFGSLTWSINSPLSVSIDEKSGYIQGQMLLDRGTYPMTVTVVDALGRSDTKTINVSQTNDPAFVYNMIINENFVTKDIDNKVSEIRSTDDILVWSQPDPLLQPTYIPDDGFGFPCIEFNNNQRMVSPTLYTSGWGEKNTRSVFFTGRIKMVSDPSVKSSILGWDGSSKKSLTFLNKVLSFGTVMDCVESEFDYIFSSTPLTANTTMTRYNGFRLNGSNDGFNVIYHGPYANIYMVLGANETYPCANFRMYDHIFWDGYSVQISASLSNAVNQSWSKKYNIPCKIFTNEL